MKKTGLVPAIAIASGLSFAGFLSNQSVFAEGTAYGAVDETAYGATEEVPYDEVEEPRTPDYYSGDTLNAINIRWQDDTGEISGAGFPLAPQGGDCMGSTYNDTSYEYCPNEKMFTIKNAGTIDHPATVDVSYMGNLKIKIEGKNYFSLRSTNTSIEFIGDGEINCNLSAGLPACIDIEDFDSEFDDTTGVKKAIFNGSITYNFIAGTENIYNSEGILITGTDIEINGGIFNIKGASNGFTMLANEGTGAMTINGGEINIEDSSFSTLIASSTNTDNSAIQLNRAIKSREANIELLDIVTEYDETESKVVLSIFVDGSKEIDCSSLDNEDLMPDIHLGTNYTNEIKKSDKQINLHYSLETDNAVCTVRDMGNHESPAPVEDDKKEEKEEDKGGIGTPKTGLFEKENSLATVPMILAGISMLIVSALVARKIKKSHKKFEYKF